MAWDAAVYRGQGSDGTPLSCSVDHEELSGALRRLGLGLKPSHIDTLMEASQHSRVASRGHRQWWQVFDEDGGGEIDREEFRKILVPCMQQHHAGQGG